MDLESNDFISTTALNHALEKAGFDIKFGKYYLSVEDLVQLGLKPAAKLRNGTYWHKEAVQQVIDKLTGVSPEYKAKATTPNNADKIKRLETDLKFCRNIISDVTDITRIALDHEDEAHTLLRVLMGYSIFALEWSEQK